MSKSRMWVLFLATTGLLLSLCACAPGYEEMSKTLGTVEASSSALCAGSTRNAEKYSAALRFYGEEWSKINDAMIRSDVATPWDLAEKTGAKCELTQAIAQKYLASYADKFLPPQK